MAKGQRPGLVVLDSDRAILRVLATAGALTARHLQRAVGDKRKSFHFERRLRQLADQRYIARFEPPSRQLNPVYMLAVRGGDEIACTLEQTLPVKMGWVEHKHFEMTGSVFVQLMEWANGRVPLPFCWRADRGQQWDFAARLPTTEAGEVSAVRPDAIVESTTHTMRVFLEVETGSHSILGTGTGSVLRKVQRYAAFATEYATGVQPPMSWYQAAFRDGRWPMIMVIAHSAPRRERVASALAEDEFLRRAKDDRWGWMVVTEQEAPLQLQRLVSGERPLPHAEAIKELGIVEEADGRPLASVDPRAYVPAEPAGEDDRSWVRMSAADAKAMGDDFRALVESFNALRSAAGSVARRAPKPFSEELASHLGRDKQTALVERAGRILRGLKSLGENPCPAPPLNRPRSDAA